MRIFGRVCATVIWWSLIVAALIMCGEAVEIAYGRNGWQNYYTACTIIPMIMTFLFGGTYIIWEKLK